MSKKVKKVKKVKKIQRDILTPFDLSAPVRIGRRRFWKQVLPVASIDYDGQQIAFDQSFHTDLAAAYEAKVYDQIPMVFAGGKNEHNEDPRNYSGEILKMENRGKDGTWALIEADRQAARLIRKNPKMGVSARIAQNVEKNGQVFKHAVRHVLMTMFPRVSTEPWQAVDLSDGVAGTKVVDLTAVEMKEGKAMAKKAKTTTVTLPLAADGSIDLSALDEAQFTAMLDLATAVAEDERTEALLAAEDDASPRKKAKKKKAASNDDDDNDVDDDDNDVDEDEDEDNDDNDDNDTDLSLTTDDIREFRKMRRENAKERWATTRAGLIRDGVPPFLVDLAAPILSSPDSAVIDLSDGTAVDATKAIREMLEKSKGLVDLSDEKGHSVDLDSEGGDDPLLDAWDKQYPINA